MPAPSGPYFIEHGDVWARDANGTPGGRALGLDRTHVCDGSQMLAVAYDEIEGTLLKHGNGEKIAAWAEKRRKQYLDAGFQEMGTAIVVVSFPVSPETVEELNAIAANPGRVTKLMERLEEIGVSHPELLDRPKYPPL